MNPLLLGRAAFFSTAPGSRHEKRQRPRTAAVATLATFALVTGVITSREEVVEAPMALVPVESSAALYFPAAYELKPGVDEPEVFEAY